MTCWKFRCRSSLISTTTDAPEGPSWSCGSPPSPVDEDRNLCSLSTSSCLSSKRPCAVVFSKRVTNVSVTSCQLSLSSFSTFISMYCSRQSHPIRARDSSSVFRERVSNICYLRGFDWILYLVWCNQQTNQAKVASSPSSWQSRMCIDRRRFAMLLSLLSISRHWDLRRS